MILINYILYESNKLHTRLVFFFMHTFFMWVFFPFNQIKIILWFLTSEKINRAHEPLKQYKYVYFMAKKLNRDFINTLSISCGMVMWHTQKENFQKPVLSCWQCFWCIKTYFVISVFYWLVIFLKRVVYLFIWKKLCIASR